MTSSPQTSRRRSHSLFRLGAAFVALCALAAACTDGGTDDASETVELSAIPLTTSDGATTTLAAYEGTPLIVNFFASWCAPCKAEMPDLESISQEFAGEVTVLGVNRDATETSWKALIDETGVTFPTVFEGQSGTMFEAIDGTFMPTTMLLDADGTLLRTVAGLQTEDSLRDLIETELLS